MRNKIKWAVAGSSLLGAAAMMTVGAGAVSGHHPVAAIHMVAADSTGVVIGADQAAVTYVNTNFPGTGVANVLTTTANTEAGVLVYDVTVVAPSGSTYVVHVQQSNDAVLSANLTSAPVTTTTTTIPPVTTPPVTTTTTMIPPVTTPSGSVETDETSGDSLDAQISDVNSGDNQDGSTISSDVTASSDDSTDGVTLSTQGILSSSDGSGDGLGVSATISGGISDSGKNSTINSEG